MLPNSAEYNAALSAKFTLPRNYLQAILANSFVSSSPKHLASPIKTYSSLKPTTSHCLGLYLPPHHTLTLVVVHKFQHLSLRETFPLTHANQLANNYLASSANQNAKTRATNNSSVECLAQQLLPVQLWVLVVASVVVVVRKQFSTIGVCSRQLTAANDGPTKSLLPQIYLPKQKCVEPSR